MSSVRRVYPALALVGLCLIAAALRLYRLDAAVLSRDEGSSWRVSRYQPLELVRHCAANVHAPLSFFLLKAWTAAFGDSVFAMRSLSALYGVLCVPLIYLTVPESSRLRGGNDAERRSRAMLDASCGMLDAAGKKRDSRDGPPTSSIQHPSSFIPYPVSSIQHPASSILHPAPTTHYGAFLAAALIAFHPLQLEVSRTARMYSLGALLTLASTWLLLRALQHGPRFGLAWFGYSLAAAGLAYTHIYGLFTIAAQLAFAAGYVLLRARSAGNLPVTLHREASSSSAASSKSTRWQKLEVYATALLPVCFAAGLILVLYSPWLPVLKSQTHEVSGKYWIPRLTLHELRFVFDQWVFGDGYLLPWPGVAGIAIAVLLSVLAIARHTPRGLLFAGMAALPWLALCVFYLATGNSVLQLRYLAMAQAALFLQVGAAMTSRMNALVFTSVVAYLAIVASHGVLSATTPIEPSALPELASWLAPQHRASDLVLVDDFRDLTRLEYYLVHAGIAPLDIRTRIPAVRPTGHTVHLGSLSGANIVYDQQLQFLRAARIWHVGRESSELGGWHQFAAWDNHSNSPYVVRGLKRR